MQNFRLKNLKPKIQNCLTQGLGFEPRTSDLESRGVTVTLSLHLVAVAGFAPAYTRV